MTAVVVYAEVTLYDWMRDRKYKSGDQAVTDLIRHVLRAPCCQIVTLVDLKNHLRSKHGMSDDYEGWERLEREFVTFKADLKTRERSVKPLSGPFNSEILRGPMPKVEPAIPTTPKRACVHADGICRHAQGLTRGFWCGKPAGPFPGYRTSKAAA